jgi:hypothetical protein
MSAIPSLGPSRQGGPSSSRCSSLLGVENDEQLSTGTAGGERVSIDREVAQLGMVDASWHTFE